MTSIKQTIETAYGNWTETKSEFLKIANLRIGFISGEPPINEEREALNKAINRLETVVFQSIDQTKTKRRFNYVKSIVNELSDNKPPRFLTEIFDDISLNVFFE